LNDNAEDDVQHGMTNDALADALGVIIAASQAENDADTAMVDTGQTPDPPTGGSGTLPGALRVRQHVDLHEHIGIERPEHAAG
jgi:hypothetical protein